MHFGQSKTRSSNPHLESSRLAVLVSARSTTSSTRSLRFGYHRSRALQIRRVLLVFARFVNPPESLAFHMMQSNILLWVSLYPITLMMRPSSSRGLHLGGEQFLDIATYWTALSSATSARTYSFPVWIGHFVQVLSSGCHPGLLPVQLLSTACTSTYQQPNRSRYV